MTGFEPASAEATAGKPATPGPQSEIESKPDLDGACAAGPAELTDAFDWLAEGGGLRQVGAHRDDVRGVEQIEDVYEDKVHSCRRADIGSTREARFAGARHATVATVSKRTATDTLDHRVDRAGLIRNDAMARLTASEPAKPMTRLIAAGPRPPVKTMRRIDGELGWQAIPWTRLPLRRKKIDYMAWSTIAYNAIVAKRRDECRKRIPKSTGICRSRRPVFHVLIALADGEKHGYAILKEVEERTAAKVQLSTGTLYTMIKRLLNDGLIQEIDERPDEDDERRRYYALTAFGRKVASAEAERMEEMLESARIKKLVRKPRAI